MRIWLPTTFTTYVFLLACALFSCAVIGTAIRIVLWIASL